MTSNIQKKNVGGPVVKSLNLTPTIISNNASIVDSSDAAGSKPEDVKSFEDILEDVGCFGPFQALTLFLYLFMEVAAAFVAFIPICVARSTSTFKNCTDEHINGTTNETLSRSILDDFRNVFEDPFKYESLVDEWDLKCGRSWIPDIFTSCLMAGMAVGNLGWSQVADWYGRRPAYLCLLGVLFTGTVLSAISPSIYFYAFARFICGSGFSGFINVSSMGTMEFMTPKWRSLANMVGPIGEGIMLLALLGYYIRPWRQLYLATLAPYLLFIPIYFLLPESPRWLLRNRRVVEAHQVLGYMAKINGRQPVPITVLEALRKQEELTTESQNQKRISYISFLKTKQLRRTAIFLFAMWFSWNVSYYGLSYNIRNVPGSIYTNLGLIGLANAIGQRSSMPASERFGRRRAVLYAMTLSAGFLVTLAVCFLTMKQVSSTLILVACFVGLFCMSCTRASLRLLSGESFPTAVRTMGLATGGLGANIAGLLTPQTAYLGSRWPSLPFFIFATVSVLGSLIVLMMKETTGNPLSDEVQKKNSTKERKVSRA